MSWGREQPAVPPSRAPGPSPAGTPLQRHSPAMDIMLSWLSPTQRKCAAGHGYFDLVSNLGHLWRITLVSDVANVYLLPDPGQPGGPVAVYCAHAPGVAEPVTWLAQKLMLETDEDGFLHRANCYACAPGLAAELVPPVLRPPVAAPRTGVRRVLRSWPRPRTHPPDLPLPWQLSPRPG